MNDFVEKIDIEFEEYIKSIRDYYYKFIDPKEKKQKFINSIKLETELKGFNNFIDQVKKELNESTS